MKTAFTPRKPRKYIGQYQPRLVDGLKKASGRALYLDDVCQASRFPGMLVARALTSPYAHARIKRMDITRALAHPGVYDILTCFDPEVQALKPTTHAWAGVGSTVPYDRWANLRFNDQQVLSDTFYYAGEKAGVVVAAVSDQAAEEALHLLEIEWEILPFYLEPQSSLQPDAVAIHPEINPAGNLLPDDSRKPGEKIDLDEELDALREFVNKGDVERGFAESDVIVEWTSAHHNADHACLDSMGCMIYWDGEQVVIYTNSYEADHTRMMVANMLEMPLHNVRVICHYLGGSFGRWNTGDQSFFLFTALLAKRTGHPVKYKHTRREDFHDTRVQITWSGKLGAKKGGSIQAASFYGMSDVGGHVNHASGVVKYVPFEISERQLAHIPNLKMVGELAYTNRIPGGMVRSTGNIQFNQMFAPLVDQLAEKLGCDPLELAIQNFGQEWCPQPNTSLAAVLQAGAARIGWVQRHPPGAGPLLEGCKRRGIGFSFHQCWHAEWEESPRGEVQVGMKLNPDMTVLLLAPTVETGAGSNNVAVFAAAEALRYLGVRPQDIRWVDRVDTDTSLKDAVQTDSAVALLMAEWTWNAAAELKQKILQIATRYFHVSVEEIDIVDGLVFQKADPGTTVTVRDLLWKLSDYVPEVPVTVLYSRRANTRITGVPYQATFVEVEVDLETGEVRVVKMVVVNDAGTVLYPTGAEGQQIGGQAIALGETLSEEIIYDRRTGRPMNLNFIDYKIPGMLDMPEIEPVLLEVWRGAGEYGAAGLGEGTLTNTPGAILNAIYNATGVRLNRLPVRPQDILKALTAGDVR
ncbi:MAG: molybdopterin-dependent oxidoreductase [Anaerolineales bacterium]|jgi:xanthine dehydrogenase molybdenum-binding subunit|nr:molybdopterin-dependent oxidoreductase [Anaerolineales bacterium]